MGAVFLVDVATMMKIADRVKICYPFDNVSGFPYVFTVIILLQTKHLKEICGFYRKGN